MSSEQHADIQTVVRNAIGAEYGRQRTRFSGAWFPEDLDLDGISFAVVEALLPIMGEQQ